MTTTDRAIASTSASAIGDALGSTVEFMTPREIVAQFGVHKTLCEAAGCTSSRDRSRRHHMSLALGGASSLKAKWMHLRRHRRSMHGCAPRPVDIATRCDATCCNFARPATRSGLSEHDAGTALRCACCRWHVHARTNEEAVRPHAVRQAMSHITARSRMRPANAWFSWFRTHCAVRIKTICCILTPSARSPSSRIQIPRNTPGAAPQRLCRRHAQAVFQSFFDTDDFTVA